MINEKLVSTVRYNGQSVGSTELTIQDTSFYPTYAFKLIEASSNLEVTFSNLQQLCSYKLNFNQVDINPGIKFIYAKIKTVDGKFVSQANAVVGAPTESAVTLPVAVGGTGTLTFNTDFFPSYIGYSAEILFYHDAAYTNLIRSIPLTVLPVTSGGLEIVPARNASLTAAQAFYPPFIEMGEDLVVRANVVGPSIKTGTRTVPFKGTVNTVGFSSTTWMPVNPKSELGIYKVSNLATNPAIGSTQYKTLLNPTDKNKQNILVTMGEAKVITSLSYPSFVDGFGWLNSGLRVTKLYRRKATSNTNARCVGIVQGASIGTDTVARLGPVVITKATPWDEANITAYVPLKGASNATVFKQSYLGKMGALTWDPALLTTRDSRRQFGKYQKSFVRTIDKDGFTTTKVTWGEISDSIANTDYGVPSDSNSADIVVLVQTHERADICNILFLSGGFLITPLTYDATGGQSNYNSPVSILVLRASEMLDTHPEWVPYPRVIKANRVLGTALGGEGVWVVTIPEGTSIDLREDRYVIQHTSEQVGQDAGFVSFSWADTRIKKEKSKITIYGNYTNFNPDPKQYAIWDLGPEASFSDPNEGRLRGELKPSNVSPWVTSDLSGPVNANASSVVALPTLGASTQYYQSSIISRAVSGQAKKFSVTARDSAKVVYQGELGLMVWNTNELTNADRRNQFGRYQASMTVPYNSANGVSTITLEQVNNDVATASWGSLTSLKDPSLMMFINTEAYSEWNNTFWGVDKIQIGINYGQGPSFTGNVSVLFMRKVGWVSHAATAITYPRVVYADVVDVGANTSHTLTINKTYMPDPLDTRYQLMAQVKPTTQSEAWVKFHWTKLTRTATNWKIDLSGGGTGNTLQIAIIDHGPGVVLFGKKTGVSYIADYTFYQPIPDDGLVGDSSYAFVPLFGPATNSNGLAQRYVTRQVPDNTLMVSVLNTSRSDTWGYGRSSARGYVGWDNVKPIGYNMKKQIPTLVARKTEVIGSDGFALTSLTTDMNSTGRVITDLNKASLIFAVVPEFGDLYFAFKRATDGKRVNFVNAATGAAFALTGSRKVNTLILEEIKVMPVFADGTPYPRVIYAGKATSSVVSSGLTRYSTNLSDASYAAVNLKNSRYQILYGFELNAAFNTYIAFEGDSASTAREWTFTHWDRGFTGSTLHVVIVDYGY